MPNPLLQIDRLDKSFGDLTLFRDLSFGLAEGDRIGLIAPNGSGKTTLLNMLTGREPCDGGRIVFRHHIRMAYLEQAPAFDPEMSVLDACFDCDSETVRLIARYEEVIAAGNRDAMDEMTSLMDLHGAWDCERRVKQILTRLKITDFHRKTGTLSGGQAKRVALAGVLIGEPELLIADEPTNHLDPDMVEWLEEYLSRSSVSLLMVTHDRYFLDRVCNRILEIDDGRLFSCKGNYTRFLEMRAERAEARNAESEKAANLLRKELEWMRRQPQARGTKAKSRVDAFHALEERAQHRRGEQLIRLTTRGSRIGKKIFEAKEVSKRFGDIRITEKFNYIFTRGEKMGIVGNNGSGKTTFVKMLLGLERPDSGTFDVGETVRFGYYSQEGLLFDEQTKVIDLVRDIAEVIDLGDGHLLTASQFLQHFLFPPEKQHSYVYKLSGGEKRRLYLCTVLIGNPNFLVLDEPTNDLDVVTLNVLEEYLAGFRGCLITVSHDRCFTDKVADHLLVFHGDAQIQDFPGNCTQYRAWKSSLPKPPADPVKGKASGREETPPSRGRRPEEKKRLTFKERQEMGELEREVELLEAEKEEISLSLSSGTLSAGELTDQSNRLSQLITLIDGKTMRWLELSERA
ncbi:MAG: ATP-binding cassette domain-containing protein [Proteiniphilum sp.]|jgi:ATP-binding cassette subfamily F protein uup|nr:ATP-binding cassette domain-containing protein [Proteiniphilum sp.]